MTTLAGYSPPERQRSFASSLTIWSNAGIDEVGELDLGDGDQAVERHPDRGADDPALGQGRVDDAVVAELVPEPLGDAEDSADAADVLAEHDDADRRAASRDGARR